MTDHAASSTEPSRNPKEEKSPMNDNYFVYKLIPPRPSFAIDMNDAERSTMGEHVAYWTKLVDDRRVVVFGPVLDPAGSWGLAVVTADTVDDVRALASHDPAVSLGMCTFDVFGMPRAVARKAAAERF
jgi:uncharacterized protein